jgi:hypothetical protein
MIRKLIIFLMLNILIKSIDTIEELRQLIRDSARVLQEAEVIRDRATLLTDQCRQIIIQSTNLSNSLTQLKQEYLTADSQIRRQQIHAQIILTKYKNDDKKID